MVQVRDLCMTDWRLHSELTNNSALSIAVKVVPTMNYPQALPYFAGSIVAVNLATNKKCSE